MLPPSAPNRASTTSLMVMMFREQMCQRLWWVNINSDQHSHYSSFPICPKIFPGQRRRAYLILSTSSWEAHGEMGPARAQQRSCGTTYISDNFWTHSFGSTCLLSQPLLQDKNNFPQVLVSTCLSSQPSLPFTSSTRFLCWEAGKLMRLPCSHTCNLGKVTPQKEDFWTRRFGSHWVNGTLRQAVHNTFNIVLLTLPWDIWMLSLQVVADLKVQFYWLSLLPCLDPSSLTPLP
jgi:hypothetical protein